MPNVDDQIYNCENCTNRGRLNAGDPAIGRYEVSSTRERGNFETHWYCTGCDDDILGPCSFCDNFFWDGDLYNCDDCDSRLCPFRSCTESHNENCENEIPLRDETGRVARRAPMPDFKLGKIITSSRPFGIELECNHAGDVSMRNFRNNFNASLFEWGGDGSLGPEGVEIKTRGPVQGEFAEKEIIELAKILNDEGFNVDEKCGYHVHLSGDDYMGDVVSLKRLWLFYLAFEDVLMSFLPKKRRDNQYCRGLKTIFHYQEVLTSTTQEDVEKLWYRVTSKLRLDQAKREHHHASRYVGINLHSLFSAGHLEVRYHSGTLNPIKIFQWISLHQAIMDKIKDTKISDTAVKTANQLVTLTEKIDLFFRILNLPPESVGYFRARAGKFNPSLSGEIDYIPPDTKAILDKNKKLINSK